MFITSLILSLIGVISLSTMALFGVLQYRKNTEDEDAETTFKHLKIILAILSLFVILSQGIMAYSHYTERNDAGTIQIEKR